MSRRPRAAAVLLACGLAFAGLLAPASAAEGYAQRADVRSFVREMVERHGFVESELLRLFSRARRQDAILKAIRPSPPERTPSWDSYRALFVNPRHIDAGLAFWEAHRAVLERAAKQYGVPEEIVVAILGVETFYGRNTGRFRVADALTTLAFDYPPRADFFRAELEHFLLLARDAELDVFSVRGSYAGAMGIPQFMPGSQRRYAVDFDRDGAVDLRSSASDAIGSVGNFLKEHGWLTGQPISVPAEVSGDGYRALLAAGIEPSTAADELPRYAVQPRGEVPAQARVALIELESPESRAREYRLGLQNFYVLTRYNRSAMYASAVADLAASLRQSRNKR
jgi:membrane-bound lytic murein transglycosylase B